MKHKHLSLEERYYISIELKNKTSMNAIAKALKRSQGTISKEIQRNTGKRGYRYQQAHAWAFDYTPDDKQTIELIANEVWHLVQKERNIQKLKEANEMLLFQSRFAAMGEMISMIAHQWRQPISIVSMCANNLLLDIELETLETPELKKQLYDILTQTEYLSHTIDDFRNFFKTDKAKEIVSLKELIQKACKLIEKSLEKHNIQVTCHFIKDIEVEIFSRELLQVLLNILTNAQEAIDERNPHERHIILELREENLFATITLWNNGGVIPEENLSKIFEPYYSSKREKNGTGLGLYMSKIIVEKHLFGELHAINHKEGVCFEIKIPRTPPQQ